MNYAAIRKEFVTKKEFDKYLCCCENSGGGEGQTLTVTFVDSGYTLTEDDEYIEASAGTFTINLPSAAGVEGRVYNIKNAGNGVITVDPNGAELIDAEATVDLSQWDAVTLISNNNNWRII